jgi:8-oxo-dGTP pyrophosphatase MutT (NUDIX family)
MHAKVLIKLDFSFFLKNVSKLKTVALGGLASQFKMAPAVRIAYKPEDIAKNNPKSAAVLALFYPDKDNKTCFVLTERAQYKGVHSAQISFPGGKIDKKDSGLRATALRETEEEIAVTNINLVRQLTTTYIPPSNFYVTPFIGYLKNEPIFKPNEEVQKIIQVKLSELLDDANLTSKIKTTSYMENIEVPCFKLNNYTVWGATAMMLSEIKDLMKRI